MSNLQTSEIPSSNLIVIARVSADAKFLTKEIQTRSKNES